MTLSPAARHVLAAAARSGRRRVESDVLRAALWEIEPHLATSPAKRERLRAVIDELAAGDHVTLPRGRALYERTPPPPLPDYVTLRSVAAARPARPDAARHPWPPPLRWAAAMRPPPGREDMEVLEAVARFLAAGGERRPVVPVQERSLALFGDEKRLDALRDGRLFDGGRLTLDLLRCAPAPPPFVWTWLSDRPALLVVENSAAHATFGQLLADGSLFGVAAYGAGKHFMASVAYALELTPRPRRILYFGDLDAEGLGIPARASQRAVSLGLPPVEPAEALYELLLAQEPRALPGRSRGAAVRELEWLPEPIRERAGAVLASGRRVPQEAVGYELLDGDSRWRAALAAQLAGQP
jgi:hypothetical protein